MAEDNSQIHLDNTDDNDNNENSSFINDSEARAWERNLYAADREQGRRERESARKDLALLWHSLPRTADLFPGDDPLAGPDSLTGYDPLTTSDPMAGYDPLTASDPMAGYDPLTASDPMAGYDPLTASDSRAYTSQDSRATPDSWATPEDSVDQSENDETQKKKSRSGRTGSSRSSGSSYRSTYGTARTGGTGTSGQTKSGYSRSGSSSGKKRTALDSAWDIISGIMDQDGNNGGSSYRSKSAKGAGSAYTKPAVTSSSSGKLSAATKKPRAKSRPRGIISVVALLYVIAMCFSFLIEQGVIPIHDLIPGQQTDGGTWSGTDGTDDHTPPNSDADKWNSIGSDYADYYTPNYICSYDFNNDTASDDGSRYQELCVISKEKLLGSPEAPKNIDREYITTERATGLNMDYIKDQQALFGFAVLYADDSTDYTDYPLFGSYNDINPPETADQDDFFEAILTGLATVKNNPSYANLEIGNLKITTISGHKITYLTYTYENEYGDQILDIVSFEQKPLDCAFITECRFLQEDYADGEETLRDLYSMFTFYTDNFETIDAGNDSFTSSRVYNSQNTNSVRIDVSDLSTGTELYSDLYYKNCTTFVYVTEQYEPLLAISLDYVYGDPIENYGNLDDWSSEILNNASVSAENIKIQEKDRQELSFDGQKVYYLSYNYTEYSGLSKYKSQFHEYLIDTADGDSLSFTVKYSKDIPKKFDPQEFMTDHLQIEHSAKE